MSHLSPVASDRIRALRSRCLRPTPGAGRRWIGVLASLLLSFSAVASTVSTPSSGSASANGAFNYAIPFRLPPGTTGVAPKLGIGYSTRAGNGIAGVGWNLSGLSLIMRCPRTAAVDGVFGGVNLDANDRLCLDGQRLVLYSGEYGAQGAVYFKEQFDGSRITQIAPLTTAAPPKSLRAISYKTSGGTRRAMSSEMTPRQDGAAVVFRVQTQGGESMDYIASDISGPNRMWLLSRVVDVRGNYWGVTYDRNSDTGEYRVTSIDYTGNDLMVPAAAPYNRVEFAYEPRPDPSYSYLVGNRISNEYRLTVVTTFASGVPVTRYTMGYDSSPATYRSRLVSVEECGYTASATWNCLQPATFAYAGDPPGDFYGSHWVGHGGLYWDDACGCYKNNLLGDFDGDGKTDMAGWVRDTDQWHITLSRAGNFEGQIWIGPGGGVDNFAVGDFNGDGKADILAYNGNPVGYWHVALSTGTSFDNQAWMNGHGGGSANNFLGDFNGDGRTDIMGFAGGDQWHVCLSTGSGWNCAMWTGHGGGHTNNQIGDFNGDGLSDLLAYSANAVWAVCLSTGSGFNCYGWPAHGEYNLNLNYIGDYNGDGKSDMMAYDLATNTWNVCLSTGASFACSLWPGHGGMEGRNLLGDFNGDGRTDAATRITDGPYWNICLSTGTAFNCTLRVATGDREVNAFIGDYNGDGKADFGAYTGANGVWQIALETGPQADLMTRVTSSAGLTTTITTQPAAASDRYTPAGDGPQAIYPIQVANTPVPIVTTLQSENGIGGLNTVDYYYARALNSLDGRGLLGFRSQESIDQGTGLVSRTEFLQAWPFTGSPATQNTWTAGKAQLIKSATSTYAARTLTDPAVPACTDDAQPGKPVLAYAGSSTARTWDIDPGASMLSGVTNVPTVDCFGNATFVHVDLLDEAGASTGYMQNTLSAFESYVSSELWILNRLVSTQVINYMPGAGARAAPPAPRPKRPSGAAGSGR